ncbi:tRNA (adenosine(37)-N6)-threonylcarbamoyltransferase complex dimerization subunit type 1 TsaB [Mageeibacillus indolicus]|uniref:tRNA (adenosine(37)-N6)-threonylcarbamoyltransferase complex dimerization subunit type 1 TsaB n=1 Tax=Mageeibacillus indolicus TaxID=884684 RepID=UPI0004DCD3C4|nr:tRNA (adenosine(37)-N6)-threonylcarbamoyltransferase complex dimerization subunit type 1 TsaB [Mageeibacillus indolicus]KFA57848.1 hypothetical protein HMPREF1632_00880 [Mageeibacillus indolicus 0009-5]
MYILSGNTATSDASTALWLDGKVIGEINLSLDLTHSETFFPTLEQLLSLTRVKLSDIDAFACVIGPGSFTGIRIGVAGMKMIASALKKPVMPVDSLTAIAVNYAPYFRDEILATALNARNGRIFAAAYLSGQRITEPVAVDASAWLNDLSRKNGTKKINLLIDNAWPELLASLPDNVQVANFAATIHAGAVAEIAASLLKQGENGDPNQLLPLYLVPSQAERLANV